MFNKGKITSTSNPKVILLVGPPLSGKDTFLNTHDFSDFNIISRDDIVLKLSNTNDYTKAWNSVDQKLVDSTLHNNIMTSIQNNENVILNLTNLSKKSRNKHLSKFPHIYSKIAIVFPKLDFDIYLNRNEKRKITDNKFIPIEVLRNMIASWEEVTENESFNKIINLENYAKLG